MQPVIVHRPCFFGTTLHCLCDGRMSLFFFLPGEGDAQAAASLPQCYLSVLRWQPAAVGTNSNTVQCKVKAPRIRQAVLAGGAIRWRAAPASTSVRWTRI